MSKMSTVSKILWALGGAALLLYILMSKEEKKEKENKAKARCSCDCDGECDDDCKCDRAEWAECPDEYPPEEAQTDEYPMVE